MILRKLTNGKISGTGEIDVPSRLFGGALISTNSSNAAAVVIRENDVNGDIIFDLSTISPAMVSAPFDISGADKIYYSISGTGASAQLYEWIN